MGYTAKVIVCAPVDPSGKAASSPFEVDVANAFSSLMLEPAISLSGAGSYAIPLGTIPAAGLRGFVLMLDPVGAPAAISVAWTNIDNTTGGLGEMTAAPLAPAVVAWFTAAPVNGVKAVTVTRTTGCTLRVVALG